MSQTVLKKEYATIYSYFDEVFPPGDGQVYAYHPRSYIISYSVPKFDMATLEAIQRKMKEMGLTITGWEVDAPHYRGKVLVRMFVAGV